MLCVRDLMLLCFLCAQDDNGTGAAAVETQRGQGVRRKVEDPVLTVPTCCRSSNQKSELRRGGGSKEMMVRGHVMLPHPSKLGLSTPQFKWMSPLSTPVLA